MKQRNLNRIFETVIGGALMLILAFLIVSKAVQAGAEVKIPEAPQVQTAQEVQEEREQFYMEWSNGEGELIDIESFELAPRGKELNVIYSEYKSQGEYLKIFNNGSFAYVDQVNNIYEFTPAECGDWNYSFNNESELERMISAYKSIYEKGYY